MIHFIHDFTKTVGNASSVKKTNLFVSFRGYTLAAFFALLLVIV